MTGEPQTNTWLALAGGNNHPLGPKTHSIGRSPSNEIVLLDHKVSRAHALIHCQNASEFVLVDLGSANGSLANGRRISGPLCLKDGDRLKFGDTECIFRQGKAARMRRQPDLEQPFSPTRKDLGDEKRWLLAAEICGTQERPPTEPREDLAIQYGHWFANSKTLIEEHGGSIDAFLGDGFLATWLDDSPEVVRRLATLLTLMKDAQARRSPPFRFAIHHGTVRGGFIPGRGESRSEPPISYVSRMKQLAARLEVERLASQEAMAPLAPHLEVATLPGQHSLTGFADSFSFFTF